MKHTVLVADGDPAFATILREALEATGDYAVTTVRTAGGALDAVRERPFDMVIVDSDLADVPLTAMIETMRATWPAIRLMLIPRANNRIPAELRAVEVQGLLPKPFFVDDLPSIVRHAMELDDAIPLSRLAELAEDAPVALSDVEAEVFFSMIGSVATTSLPELAPLSEAETAADDASTESMAAAEPEPVVSPRPAPPTDVPVAETPEWVMRPERYVGPEPSSRSSTSPPPVSTAPPPPDLPNGITLTAPTALAPPRAAETDDRAVLPDKHAAALTRIIRALQRELPTRAVVITCGNRVIASVGSINLAQQAELAQLIMDRMATSSRLMRLLDEPDGGVDLVLEEGRAMRVYTVRVTSDVLLTVATSPSLPLGSLRYRTRQVAEEIVAALR